jgi:acetyl-CoA carboxylase biotin carboxyl carrier protein
MTPRDFESLIQLFESGDWTAMELRFGDSDLFLSRDPLQRPSWDSQEGAGPQQARAPRVALPSPAVAIEEPGAVAPPAHHPDHIVVSAPSLGTFYRAAKPGAPPFVEIGHRVEPDTELCLIEVMKLFTTLRAGVSGTVSKIMVSDGEMIERGQPLFTIDPDG